MRKMNSCCWQWWWKGEDECNVMRRFSDTQRSTDTHRSTQQTHTDQQAQSHTNLYTDTNTHRHTPDEREMLSAMQCGWFHNKWLYINVLSLCYCVFLFTDTNTRALTHKWLKEGSECNLMRRPSQFVTVRGGPQAKASMRRCDAFTLYNLKWYKLVVVYTLPRLKNSTTKVSIFQSGSNKYFSQQSVIDNAWPPGSPTLSQCPIFDPSSVILLCQWLGCHLWTLRDTHCDKHIHVFLNTDTCIFAWFFIALRFCGSVCVAPACRHIGQRQVSSQTD